jgi:hypothetical protein
VNAIGIFARPRRTRDPVPAGSLDIIPAPPARQAILGHGVEQQRGAIATMPAAMDPFA